MKTTKKILVFWIIPISLLSVWGHGTLFAHAKIPLSYAYEEVSTCKITDGEKKCFSERIPLRILLARKKYWMAENPESKSEKTLDKINRVEYTLKDKRKIVTFSNGVMIIRGDGERQMSWWIKDSIIF